MMALPLFAGLFGGVTMATVTRLIFGYVFLRVIFALGVVGFSIVGSEVFVDYLESVVSSYMGNISGDIGQVLIMMGLLDGLQIIFNCWIVALNLGSIKGAYRGFKLGTPL